LETVLTHGYSRVVLTALLHAAQQGKRFSVLVTEAGPDKVGYRIAKKLQGIGFC
jgi:translation initiation factor eIF-2B subunit alpha